MPLVSVVIPYFSHEKGLLKRAVLSVISQTVSDFEVIVVDDASPQSALAELEGVKDCRVNVIKHQNNLNGALARNTGVSAARGKFVAFLDFDDIWYKDKLFDQLKLFDEVSKVSSKPVLYSMCKIIDGNRIFYRPLREIQSGEKVGDYLFCARQIIQTSGIFLESEVAKKVKFDDLKRHQDYQFCLSLERDGCEFFMLNKPSYEFVQIHKKNDYKFSLSWLNSYQDYLSSSAIKEFKSLVVLRFMAQSCSIKKTFGYACNNELTVQAIKIYCLMLAKKIYIPAVDLKSSLLRQR